MGDILGAIPQHFNCLTDEENRDVALGCIAQSYFPGLMKLDVDVLENFYDNIIARREAEDNNEIEDL